MEKMPPPENFHKLSPEEKLEFVKKWAELTDEETELVHVPGAFKFEFANRMIENAIGAMPVPLGVAVNFLINGREYIVPMAIEEPSVVAAACNGARMARIRGGFTASSTLPFMIGQVQVVNVKAPLETRKSILKAKERILKKANEQDPILLSLGRGAKDLQVKVLDTIVGPMVIAELLVDCGDAMGANAVNTMAEAVSPIIEEVSGGKVFLRIISNLADRRLVRVRAVFAKEVMGGEEVIDGIVKAYAFAFADPYRCATHNKGIMNGVDAVVLATGNDPRAIEAGAHAYAARTGRYLPLTTWEKNGEGDLIGTLEMPMAVGLVGGATRSHPVARVNVKILGVKTANELGEVIASVGLAQNLAALRALAAEGIQSGHMALHARNVAIEAGASGELIDIIARKIVDEKKIRIERAKEILSELSKKK